MKTATALFATTLGIASAIAYAGPLQEMTGCHSLPPRPQYNPSDPSTVGCDCGANLRNVSITLSKPFRVRAACNLRWRTINGDRAIDLSKEGVSFDRYTNGNIANGELLIAGRATLRGTLTFDPGPAGEWWFSLAGQPIATRGPAAALLGDFKLAGEHTPDELHIPVSLREASCWSATVTLDVSDIWLHVGESDEAGAYPAKYKVLTIAGHRRCN